MMRHRSYRRNSLQDRHTTRVPRTASSKTVTPSSKPVAARRHRDAQRRSGIATVEAAICFPVLVVLTLGTMDLCSLMFLKESVTIAAYEGARQGVGRGRTNADAIDRVNEFLTERGVTGATVNLSGGGFSGADTLENVTITVTVPCDGNLIAPSGAYGGMMVNASVTMRKEYEN